MATSIKVRVSDDPGHTRARFYAGRDADHRAFIGTLTMLPRERDDLLALLPLQPDPDGIPGREFLVAAGAPSASEQAMRQVLTDVVAYALGRFALDDEAIELPAPLAQALALLAPAKEN